MHSLYAFQCERIQVWFEKLMYCYVYWICFISSTRLTNESNNILKILPQYLWEILSQCETNKTNILADIVFYWKHTLA